MSLLRGIQDACATRLSQHLYFQTVPIIPVLSEDKHDLQNRVQQCLIKVGIGVVLSLSLADDVLDNAHPPYFTRIELEARVMENTVANALRPLGVTALDVAEAVAYVLHQYQPTGTVEAVTCRGLYWDEKASPLTYRVRFQTRAVLSTAPTRTT